MKKRDSYAAVETRNAPFVERISQLKSDHPFFEDPPYLRIHDLCRGPQDQQTSGFERD